MWCTVRYRGAATIMRVCLGRMCKLCYPPLSLCKHWNSQQVGFRLSRCVLSAGDRQRIDLITQNCVKSLISFCSAAIKIQISGLRD